MDTVAAMVLKNSKGVLALYHKKHNLWSIPLGKVEDGETPKDALIREMREELGIELLDPIKFDEAVVICNIPNPTPVRTILFSVEANGYTGLITNKEEHKHSDVGFVPTGELAKREITEATKLLLGHLSKVMVDIDKLYKTAFQDRAVLD